MTPVCGTKFSYSGVVFMVTLILCGMLSQEGPSKWVNTEIAVCYDVRHDHLPRERGLRCYRIALRQWESVSPLRFSLIDDPREASIVARAGKIDGKYVILGKSDYPNSPQSNQLYDSEEPFEEFSDEWLVALFTHELGHSLGLSHSEAEGDVMYWKVRPGVWKLSGNDIRRIRAVYPEN